MSTARNVINSFNEINISAQKILNQTSFTIVNNFNQLADSAKKSGDETKKTAQKIETLTNIANKVKGALSNMISGTVNFGSVINNAKDYNTALKTLSIQTGSTGMELNTMGNSMKNLYNEGMGDSFVDLAGSLGKVKQETGLAGTELEHMTKSALLMQDGFGLDISESMKGAKVLMSQFGLSSNEAFSMMIQGAQAGLNANGGMVDAIAGNAQKFKEMGLSSSDMMNAFVNGTNSGILSVDNLGKSIENVGAGNLVSNVSTQGSVTVSDNPLQNLNDVSYTDATSAIEAMGRTINTAFAGVIGPAVEYVSQAITDFTTGISGNAGGIQSVFGGIGLLLYNVGQFALQIGAFISDNWSILQPILLGIVAAIGLYCAALAASNIIQKISSGLKLMAAFATLIYSKGLKTEKNTAAQATVTQWGLNTALLSCPIFWIIIGIIALIAVFYAVIAAVNKFTNSSVSGTGIIMGAFATLLAFTGNIIGGALTLIGGAFEGIVNLFVSIANFLGNIFKDPIGSIVHLFGDCADVVLGILQKIAEAVDLVLGTDMSGGLKNFRGDLGKKVDEFAKKAGNGKYEEKMKKFDMNETLSKLGLEMEHLDYKKAYDSGYGAGEGIEKKLKNFGKNKKDPLIDIDKLPYNQKDLMLSGEDKINNLPLQDSTNIQKTADNTEKTANGINKTEEDMSFLRDLAQREAINKYTTAQIKVKMNNNNRISSNMDIDGVISQLETKMYETMNAAAEGVYV